LAALFCLLSPPPSPWQVGDLLLGQKVARSSPSCLQKQHGHQTALRYMRMPWCDLLRGAVERMWMFGFEIMFFFLFFVACMGVDQSTTFGFTV